MNTKILLAIAGAVTLTACAKTNKAEIVALPALPVDSPRTVSAKPSAPRPPAGDPGFRLPDPTEDLYPLRRTATTSRSRAPGQRDPLSIMPATPSSQPDARPEAPVRPSSPLAPVLGATSQPEPVVTPSE